MVVVVGGTVVGSVVVVGGSVVVVGIYNVTGTVEELVVDEVVWGTDVVVCGSAVVVDWTRVDVVDSGIVVVGTSNTVDDVVVVTAD